MNYEQVTKDLQNTLAVLREIERRNSERKHLRAEIPLQHNPPVAQPSEPSEARLRLEQSLARLRESYDRLMGKKDGQPPPQPAT